ncbi:hypothetical protein RUMOBE_01188 [Blautia obeum ATCC 29174]|uniref:Uncharacterized protein n=1 Tax=Blautia obeum ATCC 29174 TaxID=411459 RepID=A5ZQB8_9FIRM|nr:hypothetical protein RUMOBE_01188 [Blautia obeum ATCC 29174]
MVNYLFLRLILRMERTTNPSVEVPSDAAIAAAITAISSELSASCTGAAATGAGVGAKAASSAAFFFCFCFLCSGTRNELEQRDQEDQHDKNYEYSSESHYSIQCCIFHGCSKGIFHIY